MLIDKVYSVDNLCDTNYYNTIEYTIERIKNVEDYKIKKLDIDIKANRRLKCICKILYVNFSKIYKKYYTLFPISK